MSNLWDEYPQLHSRLYNSLDPGIQNISQMILQPLQGEGKMIRPRLVMMVNNLYAPPSEPALDVAIAVECIHTASLIHDDIIDESLLRRGLPSTNALYGSKASVLIGDHYFATAFRLLAAHGLNEILADLAGVVRDMCLGEINQDLSIFNPYITEEDYFSNIYGKTASLFAGACRAGALVAKASGPEVELLGQIGLHLGYAYQLADDVLDLTAAAIKLGKPTGSDLKRGIITLPVIRALEIAPEREWLARIIATRKITDMDFDIALSIIEGCGAIDYTLAAINEHQQQACRLLEKVGSANTNDLLAFINSLFVIDGVIPSTHPEFIVEVRGS